MRRLEAMYNVFLFHAALTVVKYLPKSWKNLEFWDKRTVFQAKKLTRDLCLVYRGRVLEADATFRGYVQRFLISRCANYSTLITIEERLAWKHKTQLSEALVAMRLLRPLCADCELEDAALFVPVYTLGEKSPSSNLIYQHFLETIQIYKKNQCSSFHNFAYLHI